MKPCKDCGESIADNYIYCLKCNSKRQKAKQTGHSGGHVEMAGTPNNMPAPSGGMKEVLKNINIGIWRIANYLEHMLIQKGEDPKKIRDEMWAKSQDDIAEDKNKLKTLEKK